MPPLAKVKNLLGAENKTKTVSNSYKNLCNQIHWPEAGFLVPFTTLLTTIAPEFGNFSDSVWRMTRKPKVNESTGCMTLGFSN